MKIPIVTQEVFHSFSDEEVDEFVSGPCLNGNLESEVYNTICDALDENDPGDLGFPEVVVGFMQAHAPEKLKEFWPKDCKPDHDGMLEWIEFNDADALMVFTAKYVYGCSFHYEGLKRFIEDKSDVVLCSSKAKWQLLHNQDEEE